MPPPQAESSGPLTGLKIIDLSTVIAGPLASTFLADLGAEVLKIELPDGRDTMRVLPPFKDGVPLWWKVTNRNKRGITLDVRTGEGRAILLDLIATHHVLVENFRTGTMDSWGLDAATLHTRNPQLTILRVTGFGQTGPYRRRPGFGRIFEALSGFTYLSGFPDQPPTYCGYPIGDAVAGLFGSIGILSALFHARKHPDAPGQEIDLSATEAMFRILDFLPVEFDQLGVVRERAGNRSTHNAPVNTYLTRDGKWLSLHAGVQATFERLAHLMGRADLLADERYATNAARVANAEELDRAIALWVGTLDMEMVMDRLNNADITHCPIYSIADIFADPQFAARNAIVDVPDRSLGNLKMQCVVPRFSTTPGAVTSSGPDLGQDNLAVLGEIGLDESAVAALRARGVV